MFAEDLAAQMMDCSVSELPERLRRSIRIIDSLIKRGDFPGVSPEYIGLRSPQVVGLLIFLYKLWSEGQHKDENPFPGDWL